jgi:hypothetical protein
LVWNIADPLRAKDSRSFFRLIGWRLKLLFLWFCYFAATAFSPADRGRYYYLKKMMQVICLILFFWIALPVVAYVNAKAKAEWDHDKDRPNGSDMFLVFAR